MRLAVPVTAAAGAVRIDDRRAECLRRTSAEHRRRRVHELRTGLQIGLGAAGLDLFELDRELGELKVRLGLRYLMPLDLLGQRTTRGHVHIHEGGRPANNQRFYAVHAIGALRECPALRLARRGTLFHRRVGGQAATRVQRRTLTTAGKSLPAASGPHGSGVQGAGVMGGALGFELLQHGMEASPLALAATVGSYPFLMAAYSNPGRWALTGLLGRAGSGVENASTLGPVGAQLAPLVPGLLNYNQAPR